MCGIMALTELQYHYRSRQGNLITIENLRGVLPHTKRKRAPVALLLYVGIVESRERHDATRGVCALPFLIALRFLRLRLPLAIISGLRRVGGMRISSIGVYSIVVYNLSLVIGRLNFITTTTNFYLPPQKNLIIPYKPFYANILGGVELRINMNLYFIYLLKTYREVLEEPRPEDVRRDFWKNTPLLLVLLARGVVVLLPRAFATADTRVTRIA